MKNKIILDNKIIDYVCQELRDRIEKKYPPYKSYINFIYEYGCRINELFDFRISYNAEINKVEIIPQKKNNTRILEVTKPEVLKWIEEINMTQPLFHLNKRNLQRIIEVEMPINGLMCGNKKIGGHIFRHNYIKKMEEKGYSIEKMDLIMGYTTQSVANTYAVSEIYYKN
ncbi:tyrosine-type recombinase/integrase [Riemerella columbipharyngis]|uniref:Phage integrase family protein n=1 Tax=Riemerella columbipharyngis TaxID=1071918 RepID=A0A1G6ZFK0_9FLAO|nr:tyrosine-type recombinase/integrase [Riemerella columbipharyngis]SDE01133.1 Phage integrase family protein [Riemerella columbipharyngis]SDE01434.1 Phage integrase family protein [Riemerella columbipharyngis]